MFRSEATSAFPDLLMFLEASWTSSTVIGCVWNRASNAWLRRRRLSTLAPVFGRGGGCLHVAIGEVRKLEESNNRTRSARVNLEGSTRVGKEHREVTMETC